jgi:hypothetical protein
VEENRRGGGGGGPTASQSAGGSARGDEKIGAPGSGTRCEGGGGAPTRPGAGRRGLRPVSDAAHVGVSGGNGERDGGREEAGGWASPWDGPHPSAK